MSSLSARIDDWAYASNAQAEPWNDAEGVARTAQAGTKARLASMTTAQLEELDAQLEQAAWRLVGRPAHDRRWQAVEEAIGLVEAELDSRDDYVDGTAMYGNHAVI